MIEVVNRQRLRKIDQRYWEKFADRAIQAIGTERQDVTVAFVSGQRMRQLNKQFRGIDLTTDVLSFPADHTGIPHGDEANLGEIVVAVDQAENQARENGLKFDQEVAQLILHGLLHLCGYDHETDNGQMNRLELRLRQKLRI